MRLAEAQLGQFRRYGELPLATNDQMNLTAITEPAQVEALRSLDALTLVPAIRAWCRADATEDPALVDVGSGGGVPGIPLKFASPRLRVTPLDATGKRVACLQRTIDDLGLRGIGAYPGRAEAWGRDRRWRERFDPVTARAVARLPTLLEWRLPLPLARGGGLLLAPGRGTSRPNCGTANAPLGLSADACAPQARCTCRSCRGAPWSRWTRRGARRRVTRAAAGYRRRSRWEESRGNVATVGAVDGPCRCDAGRGRRRRRGHRDQPPHPGSRSYQVPAAKRPGTWGAPDQARCGGAGEAPPAKVRAAIPTPRTRRRGSPAGPSARRDSLSPRVGGSPPFPRSYALVRWRHGTSAHTGLAPAEREATMEVTDKLTDKLTAARDLLERAQRTPEGDRLWLVTLAWSQLQEVVEALEAERTGRAPSPGSSRAVAAPR
jgi:16S rRNA (guanine527-N7)-methyltransferase